MKALKIFNYTVVAVTGILILTFAILRQQAFFKTLPTLVTLFVMLLSARANRYTFLLGGCNSVVYGLVYWGEGLYFSMLSALLISFPIQIFSFFHWKKNQTETVSTRFRRLSYPALALTLLSMIPAWAISYFALSAFVAGSYPVLDCYLFVSGLAVSVLSALRYIEAPYLNTVACVLNLGLWIAITVQTPSNINYVFISCYNLIMVAESMVTWTQKYQKQTAHKENERCNSES